MNPIANWTAEQAWFIHQWLEQIQKEILQHHKESIRQLQWREEQQDAYIEQALQMTEEEREKEGIWLEPDDSIPF